MTDFDCTPYREEILHYFLDGTPLSEATREHFLSCTEFLASVTSRLSQNVPPRFPVRNKERAGAPWFRSGTCGLVRGGPASSRAWLRGDRS